MAIVRLFLDDDRMPKEAFSYLLSRNNSIYLEDWQIVRSYDEFTKFIQTNGLPDVISFDHDLGFNQKTGYECAKFLVEYCQDNDLDVPEFLTHSANITGRINIYTLLDNYTNFRKNVAQ